MTSTDIFTKLMLLLVLSNCMIIIAQRPKDNGDIYVRQNEKWPEVYTEPRIAQDTNVDLDEIMNICNSSFSIPMDYYIQFNVSAKLPDTNDKTGMCHIRCIYEKTGLINNFEINKDLFEESMWPITTESIDACEKEEKSEVNACVRTYAIAKCLMERVIEARRNQTSL